MNDNSIPTNVFSLSRDVFKHPLFKNKPERFYAWAWLVGHAAWKPMRVEVSGRIITLDRGQLTYSIRYMAEAWGWKKDSVSRFMTRLKTETMVETVTETGQLVITICNYNEYQMSPEKSATATDTVNETRPRQHRDSTATNKNKDNKDNKDSMSEKDEDDLFGSKQKPAVNKKAKFPDFIEKEVEKAYREYRTKKKAPLNDRIINMLGNRLVEIRNAGFDPNSALDVAMERGWSGLKLDWLRNSDCKRLNGASSAVLNDNAIRILKRGELPASLRVQFEQSGMAEDKFIETMLEGAR